MPLPDSRKTAGESGCCGLSCAVRSAPAKGAPRWCGPGIVKLTRAGKCQNLANQDFCFMGDQSRSERPPGPDRHAPRGRIFVLTLLAVALIVPLGVYETIPVKQHKATASPPPDPAAQAIHDLQASLQQAVSQLRALQQTVSSDRAEIKRMSDDVTTLTGKLEALQQSFASAQQAPAVQPTEPPRQKRATAR